MKSEFLIDRQGKSFVLFAGLLDEAHTKGLKAIRTELLQAPSKDNAETTICRATVELEDGRVFQGIGDANALNVSRNIVAHAIRMAETRAKARALRDALNIGAVALEELSDEVEREDGSRVNRSTGEVRQARRPPPPPQAPRSSAPTPIADAPSRRAEPAQAVAPAVAEAAARVAAEAEQAITTVEARQATPATEEETARKWRTATSRVVAMAQYLNEALGTEIPLVQVPPQERLITIPQARNLIKTQTNRTQYGLEQRATALSVPFEAPPDAVSDAERGAYRVALASAIAGALGVELRLDVAS